MGDFDETICHVFQEGDGIIDKYQDFGLTEYQLQLIKVFRNQLQEFSDENDLPELFIDSPDWDKIIEIAEEVLKAFNYKKKRS